MARTEEQALEKLAEMLASTQEPVLSYDDLSSLLANHARATVWAPGTTYAVGQKIVTTERNGRLYVCREPGPSGVTEPDWGDAGDHYPGREVDDGADLVWEDAGPAFEELWDLRAAAQEGWLLKAARAAHEFDFSSEQQKFVLSQRHQHCLAMAARYEPLAVW